MAGSNPLIAILAIAGMPQVFGILSAQVCQAVGQPRFLSTWGAVWNLTAIAAILAGLHWGAEGVAIALAIRGWVVIPIEMMPARKTIGVGALERDTGWGTPARCRRSRWRSSSQPWELLSTVSSRSRPTWRSR